MAAAFELTRPEHAGRYEVTVYQLGWRLGGKGASGRGPAGRIEEHGLHLWMGFYENAFRLMRECYAELRRDPATCPIATGGRVRARAVRRRRRPRRRRRLARLDGALPGERGAARRPVDAAHRAGPSPTTCAQPSRCCGRCSRRSVDAPSGSGAGAPPGGARPRSVRASRLDALRRLFAYGELATLAGARRGRRDARDGAAARSSRCPESLVVRFLDAIAPQRPRAARRRAPTTTRAPPALGRSSTSSLADAARDRARSAHDRPARLRRHRRLRLPRVAAAERRLGAAR